MKCKVCDRPATKGYQSNQVVAAPWQDMKPLEWYCSEHHPEGSDKYMSLDDFNTAVRSMRLEVAGLQIRISALEAVNAELRKELLEVKDLAHAMA